MTSSLNALRVKIFADGADIASIGELRSLPFVRGFTTNPTLMRKAGVSSYRAFAKQVLDLVPDKPVSFEVLADEFDEMERQALEIASWGRNVFVKVPVTKCSGESSSDLLARLSRAGVQVNVTAIMTLRQVQEVSAVLSRDVASFVSVFAGRIADTGVDPVPIMAATVGILRANPKSEAIWASPREVLNVIQADAVGCHVITVTQEIISKLSMVGCDLDEFSLETVRMFYRDAVAAGLAL